MHPLLVSLLIMFAFGGGLGSGIAITRSRLRSEETLKRLLSRERERGRLEGSAGRGSIEPPKPWTE